MKKQKRKEVEAYFASMCDECLYIAMRVYIKRSTKRELVALQRVIRERLNSPDIELYDESYYED